MYLINILGETGTKVIFFGLMFLVFYFFIIRPKQKEEAEKGKFIDTLKKGKAVVTIGGIHGTVVDVGEETVVLEVDRKGSQITVAKQAIAVRFSA